jgi:hypothetical protein
MLYHPASRSAYAANIISFDKGLPGNIANLSREWKRKLNSRLSRLQATIQRIAWFYY